MYAVAELEEQFKRSVKKENDTFKHVDHPEEYVGKFFNPGYGHLEIFLNNSELYGFHNTHFLLKPKVGRDYFGAKLLRRPTSDENYECSFSRDQWGVVSSCHCNFEKMVAPIVFEKETSPEFRDPKYLKKFIGSYRSADSSVTIRMDKECYLKSSSGDLIPHRLNVFYLKSFPTSFYEFIISDNGSVSTLNLHDNNLVIVFEVQ